MSASSQPDHPSDWGRVFAIVAIFVVVIALARGVAWLIDHWRSPSGPRRPGGGRTPGDEADGS